MSVEITGSTNTLFYAPDTSLKDNDSSQTLFRITIYHTTNAIMLQGKFINEWDIFEYPLLKSVYDQPKSVDVLTSFNTILGVTVTLTEEAETEETISNEVKSVLDDVIIDVCNSPKPSIETSKTPNLKKKKLNLNSGKKKQERLSKSTPPGWRINIERTINKLDISSWKKI